jgi:paired amphipathic helix protein Sin3a
MNNQPPQGPSAFDREREQHLDEHTRQRVLQQQEEIAQREREYGERQERDRQQREQYGPVPPHQNNAGSIPIHQPVASRLPGAIHSPGGILANHGGSQTSGPLGAPSGPGNAFGGPLHGEASRAIQHNPPSAPSQIQQHQAFTPSILGHNPAPSNLALSVPGANAAGFGGSLQQQQQQQQQQEAASRLQQIPFGPPINQPHQIPGAPAIGQGGQQPILNVSTESDWS